MVLFREKPLHRSPVIINPALLDVGVFILGNIDLGKCETRAIGDRRQLERDG